MYEAAFVPMVGVMMWLRPLSSKALNPPNTVQTAMTDSWRSFTDIRTPIHPE
jgi:hypothetical protein